MVRAIIFDCFGVLTTEGWLPFKQKHFGHDRELEEQATDLSRRLNSGQLSYGGFIEEAAALADVPAGEVRNAIDRNVPNEELFGYINSRLKETYKLAILSNAGGNKLRQLFTAEQLAAFDDAALSFETGYIKPDRRAYEHVAEMLDVSPKACVFIDDQERHCSGAKDAGMHAICYQNFAQMKQELEPLLAGT